MGERGPDSTGFAVYGDDAPPGGFKASLYAPAADYDWPAFAAEIGSAFPLLGPLRPYGSHAIVTLAVGHEDLHAWLAQHRPDLAIFGFGERIEVFKDVGQPDAVTGRFGLAQRAGTHALGHTRMATESAVTTAHSHPFATGVALCLVHNGSLSNHNQLRRNLQREGIRFATDNDTEVASGYLTWRLRLGVSLKGALEAALHDLDGFYTFAVGTADGFTILRPDRLQAGNPGRNRRVGRDGERIPRDRDPARSGRCGNLGAAPGDGLFLAAPVIEPHP
jgi:amidophosphoribosyltransferase